MKTLLALLSTLTVSTLAGNLTNTLDITTQKINVTNVQNKIQQDTTYVDKYGKIQTTSAKDLSNIDCKEVTQIGFYTTDKGEIQVVKMPRTIKKVPNYLPKEITSLSEMFSGAFRFNQDLSQ
jgi:S-adenosylmethionine hydrolase